MRIAIFSPSLESGGAERVVVNLAQGFRRAQHEVHLVLANAHGELLPEISPQIKIINLNKNRISDCILPLARYIRSEKPDVFLSAQTHANIIASLSVLFSFHTTRLVLGEHTTVAIHLTPLYRNKGWLMLKLAKKLYPWADVIVAVSKGAAQNIAQLLKISEDKLHTIYNPVQIAEVERKANDALAHPWFAPGEKPVLLAVGRLTAAKDYPTLLRAFSLVVEKKDVRLLILGEGEERNELEKLIISLRLAKNVDLPGYVANPYAYMSRASVFVLSSSWEGFAVVLVEALSCGATIVSTNCPSGPAEILENGRYGSLVPVGDAPALAFAILEALENKRDATLQRKRAQNFSEDRAISAYLTLFRSLLND